jgi:Ser/Thr protein kinase RdoA (MazF antagonist)
MLFNAGKCLATLHGRGQKGSFAHRPRLDADTLIRQPLSSLLEAKAIPGDVRDRYAEAALAAADALEASLASLPSHRIHGDFHWGNILHDGDTLRALDFDDCAEGPAAQDIWMIAPAIDPAGVAQREKLLAGYRSIRPFPDEWLAAIGPLKAGRYVDYAAWVASRIGEAAFRSAFPSFGTREYWEAELSDLEAVVRDGLPRERVPERILKEYEEAASLTNKDYFFDL